MFLPVIVSEILFRFFAQISKSQSDFDILICNFVVEVFLFELTRDILKTFIFPKEDI